jgi:hypothetical protein
MGAFFDVPVWIKPADPFIPHPLSEALEWESFDATDLTRVTIYRDGRLIWILNKKQDCTSLSLPALPSSVDYETFLGTDPLYTYLNIGDLDASGTKWRHRTQPQVIRLAP